MFGSTTFPLPVNTPGDDILLLAPFTTTYGLSTIFPVPLTVVFGDFISFKTLFGLIGLTGITGLTGLTGETGLVILLTLFTCVYNDLINSTSQRFICVGS